MAERVLIVHRDRTFVEKAEGSLRRAGYATCVASDADEALERADATPPQVVLCAASLGPFSGFDLLKDLRRRDTGLTSAVIVPQEDARTWKAARDAGAETCLVEPLRDVDVVAGVRLLAQVRKLRLALGTTQARAGEGIFDPLTGFYTFEHFKQLLFIELKRARRYGFPLAVALLAYDPLEPPEGVGRGELLAQLQGALAVAIKKSIRDIDTPVAYKKDHVLVMMPHTLLSGALVVARRIQERVRENALRIAKVSLRPSVSIGLASAQDLQGQEFASMITVATRHLKQAQGQGGDCVMPEE